MKTAGIVAEYNPFHTGHAYQISRTRRQLGEDAAVIAVMSGNWVQQAGCAVADKWTRAELALMGGADLVLELPTVWATASAESFARGAVTLLHHTGVVDHICFGSEHGDTRALEQIAQCLDTPDYRDRLALHLRQGVSFPAARQQSVADLLGDTAQLLSTPNNNLGIEYLRALHALNSTITPLTVLRRGAAHNSIVSDTPDFLSATQIRRDLAQEDWSVIPRYLLPGTRQLLERSGQGLPSLERVERAILSRLRTMTARDWAALPDSGDAEGLPLRLEKAGKTACSIGAFLDQVKTKRYTHARLRRLVLWAYLGITAAQIPPSPPYLRVLAFNDRGRELLKEMKTAATLPVLTKPAHARGLEPEGAQLFCLEARCTDLYDLCFPHIPTPGREWTTGPVFLPEVIPPSPSDSL